MWREGAGVGLREPIRHSRGKVAERFCRVMQCTPFLVLIGQARTRGAQGRVRNAGPMQAGFPRMQWVGVLPFLSTVWDPREWF